MADDDALIHKACMLMWLIPDATYKKVMDLVGFPSRTTKGTKIKFDSQIALMKRDRIIPDDYNSVKDGYIDVYNILKSTKNSKMKHVDLLKLIGVTKTTLLESNCGTAIYQKTRRLRIKEEEEEEEERQQQQQQRQQQQQQQLRFQQHQQQQLQQLQQFRYQQQQLQQLQQQHLIMTGTMATMGIQLYQRQQQLQLQLQLHLQQQQQQHLHQVQFMNIDQNTIAGDSISLITNHDIVNKKQKVINTINCNNNEDASYNDGGEADALEEEIVVEEEELTSPKLKSSSEQPIDSNNLRLITTSAEIGRDHRETSVEIINEREPAALASTIASRPQKRNGPPIDRDSNRIKKNGLDVGVGKATATATATSTATVSTVSALDVFTQQTQTSKTGTEAPAPATA